MSNKTLAIIKPDAVNDNHVGEIISMINKAGFKIKALKMIKLSEDAAKAFYEIHKEKPFYGELVYEDGAIYREIFKSAAEEINS